MRLLTLLAAFAISTSATLAQTPAVKSPNTTNPAAPVPGANSFTEGQAKSKIESNGFTNVSGLKKDDSGVWTGSAMKGGKKVNVKLDFQGNVTSN
jgi:putative membrane protein